MSSTCIDIANIDKKVPFYPTPNIFLAIAADEEVNKGTNPATYFQVSKKEHADTLAAAVLGRIVSFCGAKGKAAKLHEDQLVQQDAKLVVMPPEKKGLPPGLQLLYGGFKSIGTVGTDLKVSSNFGHTDLGITDGRMIMCC